MCSPHPTPLNPIVSVGPFTKWGIDFRTCKPASVAGHNYIIVAINHFTKWVEAMPTYLNDVETAAQFLLNRIITRFGIPKAIVTDHGLHFCNNMIPYLNFIMKTCLHIIYRQMVRWKP